MTRKEAIKILKGAIKKPNTKDGYLGQAIDIAINSLEIDERYELEYEQIEPCEVEEDKLQQAYNKGFEDCRKAVLEPYRILDDRDTICVRWLREYVEQIQPVNPQEPKAESEVNKNGVCSL